MVMVYECIFPLINLLEGKDYYCIYTTLIAKEIIVLHYTRLDF